MITQEIKKEDVILIDENTNKDGIILTFSVPKNEDFFLLYYDKEEKGITKSSRWIPEGEDDNWVDIPRDSKEKYLTLVTDHCRMIVKDMGLDNISRRDKLNE